MTDQTKYTAVKCEYIAATTQMLQCTANKDMTIEGKNGAKVELKKGEKFTLVRSDSLGEGWFYIVRQVSGEKKCSCPSHKPCKHEKAVKVCTPAKATVAQKVESFKRDWGKPSRQREDRAETAPLTTNRGFSLMK